MEFPSAGTTLRGRLYGPAGGTPWPAVVMAHGFSATITGMVADRYAEAIARGGMTVLLFDHRGFGLSGGEPRQVLNAWDQAIGYRDALTHVATCPGVDPARLGVWGDSMSGSVALCVAGLDPRVRAVVAQVPACGSAAPPADPDASGFAALSRLYLAGGPTAAPRERIGPQPVVSPDQQAAPSLLTPLTAFRWFSRYGRRRGTGWRNWATLEIPDSPVPLQAGTCAPHLRAASLWAIAADDEMPGADPEVARRAFEGARGPKELLDLEGGHFGLLEYPGEIFERASAAQVDFLRRRL